jgi:protein-tyrosine-phosphatase
MYSEFPYKSILAVCSVGVARSPMVVGFLKDIFNKYNLKIKVHSGGISSHARDGMLISLDAKLAMEEEGIILPDNSLSIDLKKHVEYINNADLVLTLTEKHKKEISKFVDNYEKVLTLKEFAGEIGDIEDPSMKGIEGFRKARDEIKYCIFKGIEKLGI